MPLSRFESLPVRLKLMKTLIVRLSSLGDLILSTSGLEALDQSSEVHWLTSAEFGGLLDGHPSIHEVIRYDRKRGGVFSWVRLGLELRRRRFTRVIDLHCTQRTFLLRLLLWPVAWSSVKKRRWRRWGLFLFKDFWPESLQPKRWTQEFSGVLAGSREHKPDLRYLLREDRHSQEQSLPSPGAGAYYYAVMADSAWEGKCWPVDRYVELVCSLQGGTPVILGTRNDTRSAKLIEELELRGAEFVDRRNASWQLLAETLTGCKFLVGNDTGLAHFAESLGVPVVVIYGPTSPALGFAPHLQVSKTVESRVGCRPCSADGRFCYWSGDSRFKCLKEINVPEVRGACHLVLQALASTEGL
jgi:heptosyltransferase-2